MNSPFDTQRTYHPERYACHSKRSEESSSSGTTQDNASALKLDEMLRLWLICLILIPILVAVAWGDIYTDAAYTQFSAARAVARGSLTLPEDTMNSIALYRWLLALAYRGGLPLPSVALILSMLGWILAVVTWFFVGLHIRSRHFAVAAASLLALHPLQPQVLGLETGLVLAAMGGVVLAGTTWIKQHTGPRHHGQLSVSSIGAMIGAILCLAGLHPLWLLWVIPVIVLAFIPSPTLPKLVLLSILWAIILFGIGWRGELKPHLNALLWVTGQLGLAAGFAWVVPNLTWLHNPVASSTTFRRGIALVILISLLLLQTVTLFNAWRARPVEQLRLDKALAAWLHAQSLPDETIGAHRAGLIEYLADRTTIALTDKDAHTGARALLQTLDDKRPDYCLALPGVAWDGVRAQPWFQERYQMVHREASAYASIAPLTLFRYTPSPFDTGERRSVWRPFFDTREQSIATGRASSPSGQADADHPLIELLDYRLSQRRITPGEPLYLTLYWSPDLLEAPSPPELGEDALDVDQRSYAHYPIQIHVKLIAPATHKIWASVAGLLPDDLATEFWNLKPSGDEAYLISRHVLWPPEKIPEGDYNLNIALQYQNGRPLFVRAMAAGAQDSGPRDTGIHDHLVLTTLYHPPDISRMPFTPDHALQMTLGLDENSAHHPIALLGYDAPERVTPGDNVRIALYWHARRTSASDAAQDDDAALSDDGAIPGDYKVFVHILSPAGEVIAREDSKPVYWFYPTNQWKLGDYIRDEHVLALSPDTPRGDYWITVGMYDSESGERLAIQNVKINVKWPGYLATDQRIMLQPLKVR